MSSWQQNDVACKHLTSLILYSRKAAFTCSDQTEFANIFAMERKKKGLCTTFFFFFLLATRIVNMEDLTSAGLHVCVCTVGRTSGQHEYESSCDYELMSFT